MENLYKIQKNLQAVYLKCCTCINKIYVGVNQNAIDDSAVSIYRWEESRKHSGILVNQYRWNSLKMQSVSWNYKEFSWSYVEIIGIVIKLAYQRVFGSCYLILC